MEKIVKGLKFQRFTLSGCKDVTDSPIHRFTGSPIQNLIFSNFIS